MIAVVVVISDAVRGLLPEAKLALNGGALVGVVNGSRVDIGRLEDLDFLGCKRHEPIPMVVSLCLSGGGGGGDGGEGEGKGDCGFIRSPFVKLGNDFRL